MPRWFGLRRPAGLVAVLALGLALRLAIAWTSLPALVGKALPDDAFYYFTIVEKALAGQGVTFDGLAPTNGFHPLWALLLAPILALSPTRDAGIHIALTLAALLDTATIYLAFRAGRRLTGDVRAGVWAAALYGLNPRLILESVNGLETAASTFCFALFATYYLHLTRPATKEAAGAPEVRSVSHSFIRGRIRGWPLLGALAGLAVWGRTDALLIVGVVGLDACIRLIRVKARSEASSDAERAAPNSTFAREEAPFASEDAHSTSAGFAETRSEASSDAERAGLDGLFASEDAHSSKRGGWLAGAFAPLAAAGLACLAVLAPWLIWNQITFATPLQSSGVAIPYVVRAYLFELSGTAGLLRLAGPPLYLASVLLQNLFDYAPLPLAGLLAYLLWRATSRGRVSRYKRDLPLVSEPSRYKRDLRWAGWVAPLAGSGLLLLVHAFGRYFLRGWYFVPFLLALSVLAGAALAQLGATIAGPPRARRAFEIGAALVIALMLIAGGVRLWRQGNYPWQAAMLDAARWAATHTDADATIGAFNAGIMGWFSGRRTLNLDGVVSGPAFAAVRRRELLAFCRQGGVDYIVDWRSSVEETYAPFFEAGYQAALDPIARFDAPAGAGDVWDELIAYRVKP